MDRPSWELSFLEYLEQFKAIMVVILGIDVIVVQSVDLV